MVAPKGEPANSEIQIFFSGSHLDTDVIFYGYFIVAPLDTGVDYCMCSFTDVTCHSYAK